MLKKKLFSSLIGLLLVNTPVSAALSPCTLTALILNGLEIHPELTGCKQCYAVNVSFPAKEVKKTLHGRDDSIELLISDVNHRIIELLIEDDYCNNTGHHLDHKHASGIDSNYQIACSQSEDITLEITVNTNPGYSGCQNYPNDDFNFYAPIIDLVNLVGFSAYQIYFGSYLSGVHCEPINGSYSIKWQYTDCDNSNRIVFVTLENHRGDSIQQTVPATFNSAILLPDQDFGEAAWVHVYPELNPEGIIGESVPCMGVSTIKSTSWSERVPEGHRTGNIIIVKPVTKPDSLSHFSANPDHRLFIALSLLQANDLFIAFAESLALYDEQGHSLYSHKTNITDKLRLWDLGELNNIKPAQHIHSHLAYAEDPRNQVRFGVNEFGNLPVKNAQVDQLIEVFLHSKDNRSHTLTVNILNATVQPNPLCHSEFITFSNRKWNNRQQRIVTKSFMVNARCHIAESIITRHS